MTAVRFKIVKIGLHTCKSIVGTKSQFSSQFFFSETLQKPEYLNNDWQVVGLLVACPQVQRPILFPSLNAAEDVNVVK